MAGVLWSGQPGERVLAGVDDGRCVSGLLAAMHGIRTNHSANYYVEIRRNEPLVGAYVRSAPRTSRAEAQGRISGREGTGTRLIGPVACGAGGREGLPPPHGARGAPPNPRTEARPGRPRSRMSVVGV